MNGVVPFRMFPAVAVEGANTMLPAGVTVDSSVVMRESLLSTAVFTVLKLPFTSAAFAGVPAVKVVKGPTGPARPPSLTKANSAAIHRIFRFVFIVYPFQLEFCRCPVPYSGPTVLRSVFSQLHQDRVELLDIAEAHGALRAHPLDNADDLVRPRRVATVNPHHIGLHG